MSTERDIEYLWFMVNGSRFMVNGSCVPSVADSHCSCFIGFRGSRFEGFYSFLMIYLAVRGKSSNFANGKGYRYLL